MNDTSLTTTTQRPVRSPQTTPSGGPAAAQVNDFDRLHKIFTPGETNLVFRTPQGDVIYVKDGGEYQDQAGKTVKAPLDIDVRDADGKFKDRYGLYPDGRVIRYSADTSILGEYAADAQGSPIPNKQNAEASKLISSLTPQNLDKVDPKAKAQLITLSQKIANDGPITYAFDGMEGTIIPQGQVANFRGMIVQNKVSLQNGELVFQAVTGGGRSESWKNVEVIKYNLASGKVVVENYATQAADGSKDASADRVSTTQGSNAVYTLKNTLQKMDEAKVL